MTLARHVAAVVTLAVFAPAISGPIAGQRRLTVAPAAADLASESFLERYSRGEASAGEIPAAALSGHLQQLRRVAPRWVGTKDSPDSARRRLAVATYVAELIDENFELIWRQGSFYDLVGWACGLLREAPARPAERDWHVAAIALLERADSAPRSRGVPGLRVFVPNAGLKAHVTDAELRFPGDGEWALARAIDLELQTWPLPRDEQPVRQPAHIEGPVVAEFRRAAAHAAVGAEAHLRLGFFELRQGQVDTALAEFDRAGTPADRVLRYWLHLFRGRALSRTNRGADAVAAFRRALVEVPDAQSATISLGAALVAERQMAEAGDLVNRMLVREPPLDPWRYYGFPAYRHWPQLVAGLRQAVRP